MATAVNNCFYALPPPVTAQRTTRLCDDVKEIYASQFGYEVGESILADALVITPMRLYAAN